MITFLLVLAIIALSLVNPAAMLGALLILIATPFPFWPIVGVVFGLRLALNPSSFAKF